MAKTVQSVERALKLLEVISEHQVPLTVPQMAKLTGVNRATAWRLLNTLEFFDLIQKDAGSNEYSISLGVWRIAQNTNLNQLIRKSRPILEKVVKITGGTAFLEISSKNKLIVLDECKSKKFIQVDLLGVDVPLHCGSVGKLYLSSLDESELNSYLKNKLEPYTHFTIVDKKLLKKEIELIRKKSISFNYKEHDEQWCGITSVVKNNNGKHFAYINLTLPTYSTSEKKLHSYTNLMQSACKDLENKLFN